MSEITLGIIGGGQLGSMLAIAAKKLNVKTVVFCDDIDAPAQNFCNQFVTGSYDNKEKISEFIKILIDDDSELHNIINQKLNDKQVDDININNCIIFLIFVTKSPTDLDCICKFSNSPKSLNNVLPAFFTAFSKILIKAGCINFLIFRYNYRQLYLLLFYHQLQ